MATIASLTKELVHITRPQFAEHGVCFACKGVVSDDIFQGDLGHVRTGTSLAISEQTARGTFHHRPAGTAGSSFGFILHLHTDARTSPTVEPSRRTLHPAACSQEILC